MPSSFSPEIASDLELVDLTFGSKSWDRRKLNETREWAVTCLEQAASHLIEDQMRPDRTYLPGAKDAVELLREAILAVKAEALLDQRASRVAASWLPKYTLARHSRNGDSDA